MSQLPASRGHARGGMLLANLIDNLADLIDLDEFPSHAVDLERARNVLLALHKIRQRDRLIRRSARLGLKLAVPDDPTDDLPPFPPAVRPFPSTSA